MKYYVLPWAPLGPSVLYFLNPPLVGPDHSPQVQKHWLKNGLFCAQNLQKSYVDFVQGRLHVGNFYQLFSKSDLNLTQTQILIPKLIPNFAKMLLVHEYSEAIIIVNVVFSYHQKLTSITLHIRVYNIAYEQMFLTKLLLTQTRLFLMLIRLNPSLYSLYYAVA